MSYERKNPGKALTHVYLFAAVDAVLTEDRSASCGHPDSSQRVAVNLILLNHSLAFLMLKKKKGRTTDHSATHLPLPEQMRTKDLKGVFTT